MPSQTNITNIPSSRVDFIDPRTGLMSREWYRFFLNLFNLTGAGNNPTSLDDLQLGPPTSGGSVTSVGVSVPTGLTVSNSPITSSGVIAIGFASGYSIPTNASQANWDTAYAERLEWNGGSTNLVPATGRTSLGGTTIGQSMFTLANPSAITFPQFNANNTVSALDAASFRAAIGAGTGFGSVTSVAMTVPTGLSISGSPITTTGTLALTFAAGYSIPTNTSQANWDTAYSERQQWDGGATNLVASTGRTSLGGTTLGQNMFTLTNPSAITFPRFNADNTVSALSAADFRTATSSGTVNSVGMTVPTGLSISGSPITNIGTLALTFATGYSIPTTSSQANWDTAYSERQQWDGGSTNLVAATGRTSLGATTVGGNFFTLTNPSAITFPRINADNTVSALDAATFRTAIGAGTSSTTGTVTSVATAGTVSGLTLTGGPITTTGTITLGGTLAVTPSNFSSQTANTFLAAPNGSAGTPTFRTIVAADVPTLNQNTTGTASNVTGVVAVANGGSGASTLTGYLKGNGTSAFTASTTIPAADISGLTNYTALPSSITVTASPFTYTNSTAYNADVLVSGGGISKLEFSRDGTTFYDTGSYYGMFSLSPSDKLRVTYATAPTMTLIPR